MNGTFTALLIYFNKIIFRDETCEVDRLFFPSSVMNAIKEVDERLRILMKYFDPDDTMLSKYIVGNLSNYSYSNYSSLLNQCIRNYGLKHPEEASEFSRFIDVNDPVLYCYYDVFGDSDSDFSKRTYIPLLREGPASPVTYEGDTIDDPMAPNTPVKRSKAGKKAKIWISGKCPIILREQDPIKTAREKIEFIWNDIKNGLNKLVYPPGCDKGARKEQAVNALGASLIYYAAIKSRIAIRKTNNEDNNKTIYDTSFGNTVSFISPISTVRPYWDMISLWFDFHRIQNNIERKNLYERIKKQNSKTKLLDIIYVNHTKLIEIIETISRRLEEEFSK